MADPKALYEYPIDIEMAMKQVIDWDTGEVTDEGMDKHLKHLIQLGSDKVLAVALYREGLLREAEMVKREVTRLASRQKIHEDQAEKLKEYIAKHAPGIVGKDTIKNHLISVGWKKNPPRVVVDVEPWQLKPEHQHPPKIEANKAAIGKDLKGGKEVAGCRLVQDERLVIK